MNCQEFKNQFEESLKLSETAKTHLLECSDCEAFQSESLQLTQMISSLPNVEAPKNFEFGFKSKLVKAQLKKPLSPIWQTLRYILPVTAAALIFGFVFVNSDLFTSNNSAEFVEEKKASEQKEMPLNEDSFTKAQPPSDDLVAENEDSIGTEKAPENLDSKGSVQKEELSIPLVAENKPKAKNDSKEDEIITKDIKPDTDSLKVLSRDNAVTNPEKINPPGILDREINQQMPQATKSFTAKEILSQLGIETYSENGQLKVRSISENSIGENSGVRIGDLITAIDGQRISDKPPKNRTVQGKTLKLKRGNKELYIVIRN